MAISKVPRKFFWQLFFFFLGFISLLSQTAILREITSLFYGNEIFYGLGLGLWLFFVGLGSLIAPKFRNLIKGHSCLFVSLTTLALLLPTIVIVMRFAVAKFVPFGELPNLWLAVLTLLATLFLFCFSLGLLFPLALSFWQKKDEANQAYFWETIGLAAGGLLFSFFLSATSFPLSPSLNKLTLELRYPNLKSVINSKYNQIIITRNNDQENLFLSGHLAFTTKENYENEKFIALIKPFAKDSRKILALASPGLINSLKKEFSNSKTDFLEIDSQLLRLEEKILSKEVNPIVTDPRKFLNQTSQKWDLIVYTPGSPQTLLSNRYFTKESFIQTKKCLSENGVFILTFYLPTDYQSSEASSFGNSIFQTFKNVFPHVKLLTPEDQIVLIGGTKEIILDKNVVAPKWRDYFFYQLDNPQREQIASKLSAAKTKLNSDSEPTAFFFQQLFWQTILSFKIAKLISQLTGIIPAILLFVSLWELISRKIKISLGVVAGSSSFILISLETLIVFMFQTKIGYLYSQIGLIFSSVLAGMAVGVKIISPNRTSFHNFKKIFLIYGLAIGLFWIILETNLANFALFWFACAFVFGLLGGVVFALTNNLYLEKEKHPGFIYAFDLFGGALGALLTSSFLLPTFGTLKLLLLLAGIILINFLTTAKLR